MDVLRAVLVVRQVPEQCASGGLVAPDPPDKVHRGHGLARGVFWGDWDSSQSTFGRFISYVVYLGLLWLVG